MARDREIPPPLEMICLNALYVLGEGNVDDVRRIMAVEKPLAYTTVLTLLDRLEKRGAVSRRKEGRGFRYQAAMDRHKLREAALAQFVEIYFDGSRESLRAFLKPLSADAASA